MNRLTELHVGVWFHVGAWDLGRELCHEKGSRSRGVKVYCVYLSAREACPRNDGKSVASPYEVGYQPYGAAGERPH